jgi:hypothetical protein
LMRNILLEMREENTLSHLSLRERPTYTRLFVNRKCWILFYQSPEKTFGPCLQVYL